MELISLELHEVRDATQKASLTNIYKKEYERYRDGNNEGLSHYFSYGRAHTPDSFLEDMDFPGLHIFTLSNENLNTVGWGDIHTYWPSPSYPEISYYILSEERKKGWGNKLVKGLMLYVKDILNTNGVSMTADSRNIASHKVFESAARSIGYKAVSSIQQDVIAGCKFETYTARVNFRNNSLDPHI